MSSTTDSNKSVVCLDTTVIDCTTDDEDFAIEDFVNLEGTLPPGVAPEGFIVLDESVDMPNTDKDDKTLVKSEVMDVEQPMFKVMFRDEAVARQYKKRVKEFLHRLIVAEDKKDDSDASSLVLEVWQRKSGRKRSCDHLDSRIKIETVDTETESDNLLFTIDKKPLMQNRLDVPTYGKKFERVMETSSGETKPKDEEKCPSARPKMNCWNCLGNHSIRDCPEPRNPMEIAKNRTEFQSRPHQRCGRYHVEDDQSKYGHFVPGQMSKELKRALGLRDSDLPRHIYRMRILGYPPGWLKEARLQHSGMNLYDSDGLRELDPLEEPGQIPEVGDKDQYDVNKLHDYPGFNVPAPAGTKELEKMYFKSDQYLRQSKTSMLAMMSEKKVDGYQRKKLKRSVDTSSGNGGRESASTVPCEMDVVEDSEGSCIIVDTLENGEFVPPLPKSAGNPPLPPEPEDTSAVDSPKPSNSDLDIVASPNDVDSPSLADLERRKKQLLDELENSNSPKSSASTPVSAISSSTTNVRSSTIDHPETEISSNARDVSENSDNAIIPITPSHGSVKSVSLGTPILESTSPYNKLPSVEKFSKDVCDIINFENLPDSTGKYEQMSDLLHKVRNTLATIQHD